MRLYLYLGSIICISGILIFPLNLPGVAGVGDDHDLLEDGTSLVQEN